MRCRAARNPIPAWFGVDRPQSGDKCNKCRFDIKILHFISINLQIPQLQSNYLSKI